MTTLRITALVALFAFAHMHYGWKGVIVTMLAYLVAYALGGTLSAIHSARSYGLTYRQIATALVRRDR